MRGRRRRASGGRCRTLHERGDDALAPGWWMKAGFRVDRMPATSSADRCSWIDRGSCGAKALASMSSASAISSREAFDGTDDQVAGIETLSTLGVVELRVEEDGWHVLFLLESRDTGGRVLAGLPVLPERQSIGMPPAAAIRVIGVAGSANVQFRSTWEAIKRSEDKPKSLRKSGKVWKGKKEIEVDCEGWRRPRPASR